MTTGEAYTICRTIAQKEAKNFYYAFRVLPEHKRNAMCAVYAFMRRADDISDDETLPIVERREVMAKWLAAWREARWTGVSEDAVFLALSDSQKRFAIPDALLEDLVRGTTMDLEPRADSSGEVQTFATFEDLYRYCYFVASVVGLVCIKIFGYTDPRAEKLAEETGVAFQLTNILRDVKEDAERARIYLPLDLLQEFRVSIDRVRSLAGGSAMQPNERAMLQSLGAQAERYYQSAGRLLPLIDADSRAALWVLVTIYEKLLEKIARKQFDVYGGRISLTTFEKIKVLGKGFLKRLT